MLFCLRSFYGFIFFSYRNGAHAILTQIQVNGRISKQIIWFCKNKTRNEEYSVQCERGIKTKLSIEINVI